MIAGKRKKLIVELLNDTETVIVQDIVDKFNVSPITVRRDLAELEKQGLLVRTHGGAMKPDNNGNSLHFFDDRVRLNRDKKEEICRIAANYVNDNDTIFIDCGSTIFRICKYIKNVKKLIIITNSLPVVSELIMINDIKINLVGGEVDQQRKAVYGRTAEKFISGYHADKAFIGADGVCLEHGLTSYDEKESLVTKTMAHHSSEVFLLCDSTKLDKKSYLKFAPLDMVDHLITDSNADKFTLDRYKKNGLDIITS